MSNFLDHNRPVFCTLHAAGVERNPSLRMTAKHDWTKVPKILDGRWPRPLPSYKLIDRSRLDWHNELPPWHDIVIDCEWDETTYEIYQIGMYAGDGPCFIYDRNRDGDVLSLFLVQFRDLIASRSCVFQNAPSDLRALEESFGITWDDFERVDCTTFMHSVRWSEMRHNLNVLARSYGQSNWYKDLGPGDYTYLVGDLAHTWDAYDAMMREFLVNEPNEDLTRTAVAFSPEWFVYDRMREIIPAIVDNQCRGIRVNKPFVVEKAHEFTTNAGEPLRRAAAYCGYEINLNGGPQVGVYLRDVDRLDGLRKTKTGRPALDKDDVARLLETYPENELLRAKQAYITNEKLYASYIKPLLLEDDDGTGGVDRGLCNGDNHDIRCGDDLHMVVTEDDNGRQHVESDTGDCGGDNGRRDSVRNCVDDTGDIRVVDRIYPEVLPFAQATGRWSIIRPPMSQLPVDLREIVCPDPWETWVVFDWSGAEVLIMAAEANDETLLSAIREGYDLHTINTCEIFGWHYPTSLSDPHTHPNNAWWRQKYDWKGKDDPRRIFAKRFMFRMFYRGHPSSSPSIPGFDQLGVDRETVIEGSYRWLDAHPALKAKWREWEADVRSKGWTETALGRRRRLFHPSIAKKLRQGCNHPMQGFVADMLNRCVGELWCETRHGGGRFVTSIHDSIYWGVHTSAYGILRETIETTAQPTYTINGHDMTFTADFTVKHGADYGGTVYGSDYGRTD